ncbi:GyrI-like domain-containing protein [uncultured Winogradskyella sp.]|uniref:SRPBCC family protein n=1 Tax=uncultured Winogradskyella sp. TaxID=395353 RepID=UPI0030DBB6C5|tara:strand:- start:46340 stop:47359 length:1020 start_codon:yes stop_codon:yes gene_type:complete
MKFLKYILLLLLIAIIGFSIYIAVQPNSFKVTRTKTIDAPQAVIYNNVIDFKNWEAWSYLTDYHPETVTILAEKTKGINGSYAWQNNKGNGSITTVKTNLNTSITQKMQFGELPESEVNWNFKTNEDSSTEVTWTISGKNLPFKFKMLSALMGGMEKQIGAHFKNGLTKLDSVLQAEMKVYTINVKGITAHSGGYYLYNSTSGKFSTYKENMKVMLPKLGAYALTHNIAMAGAPFILYHKWDKENDAVIFSSCIPTNSKIVLDEPDILTGKLESFKAVKTVLKGDYANLEEAWETTITYITENNLEMIEGGQMLETYINNPTDNPNPADWITEIFVAIK